MRIKKMYQGGLPENKILNVQSESSTDTYSCDYINNLNFGVDELDELPIDSIIEYAGTDVPDGWELVADTDEVNLGVVLYDSEEGSNQDITVDRTLSDFEYYDIVYGITSQKFSKRIPGDTPSFTLDRWVVVDGGLFSRVTTYDVVDNTIKVKAYAMKYDSNKQVITETSDSSPLAIFKIVGYTQPANELIIEEKQPSAITAINETATDTTSVYGFVNIPMTLPRNPIIGEELTISDGGIKIGKGVSHVRVSGFGMLNFKNNGSTTHTYMLTIRKNDEMLARPMLPITASQEIKEQLLVVPSMVIEVQEGDIIYLSSYTVSAQVSRSAMNNCTLSVEVVNSNTTVNTGLTDTVEIYSTEEQVIGTYFDKPLYRKCFKHQFNGTYDDTPTNQMISFIQNAIGSTVESVVRLSATASNSNLDRIANLGYSYLTHYGSIEYRTYAGNNGGDMLQIGLLKNITGIDGNTITLNNTVIDVIFEYTKVAD